MWGWGTVLGGRYTLAERLGGGAMGEVWRAEDGVLERQVAVKILLPALSADAKFAERFRREAKVLAALDHPGIVDVHDYGESESEPQVAYIVMELVDGRPLDAVVADDDAGTMPADRVLGIAAQALDALYAAHRRGIVHRDVKPSNLMIGTEDRVTVTDFGIAHSEAETRLTASHAVLGTARYIAPEQARGSGAVPASDQYAIGVVCYELLTGEALFPGDVVFEVVLKHIREPAPELPAQFPEAVRAFVAKALAKAPKDRYADAARMAVAAREAMGAAGAAAAVVGGEDAGKADSGDAAFDAAVVAVPVPEEATSGDAAAPGDPSPGTPADQAPTGPEASTPDAAPDAVDVAASSASDPAKPDPDPRDATAKPARTSVWKRHGIGGALLVLGVIAGVVATVLVVNPFSGQSAADRGSPNAQGTSSGSRIPGDAPSLGATTPPGSAPTADTAPQPTGSTPPSASPSGAATGPPNANAGGKQAPGTPQGGTGATQGSGAVPPPGGGKGAGTNASPGAGGSSDGDGTGGGTKPNPPASTPPPTQTVPQGCGGDRWGAITSVADSVAIGLVADGPGGGKEVVTGGHTQYGWVHSVSTWDTFNSCSLSGPALGQPYQSAQRPELAVGFGYSVNWRLVDAPTSGAVYIKDYLGQKCLTNNGAGKPLSVVNCTPGNKYQQWRIP
jgi:serine/threonine-protein kinase